MYFRSNENIARIGLRNQIIADPQDYPKENAITETPSQQKLADESAMMFLSWMTKCAKGTLANLFSLLTLLSSFQDPEKLYAPLRSRNRSIVAARRASPSRFRLRSFVLNSSLSLYPRHFGGGSKYTKKGSRYRAKLWHGMVQQQQRESNNEKVQYHE